ncbi:hypothetical protein [Streptomyces sp. NPDC020965]|uniref:hypothetical protein n=1 Tax=Streptomyces sp. NPDC020965 TaxID=3365105 RepID=UPI0037B9CAFF
MNLATTPATTPATPAKPPANPAEPPTGSPATPQLAAAAPSATTARHRPSRESSPPPPVAGPCDLVTVPARQGLEAVDILRRSAAPAVGPVLHDGESDTLGFLVPPGTADGWDMPGSACTGTWGHGPCPALTEPAARGTGWLLPPSEVDPLTDPATLREALGEAARLIEAADSRR